VVGPPSKKRAKKALYKKINKKTGQSSFNAIFDPAIPTLLRVLENIQIRIKLNRLLVFPNLTVEVPSDNKYWD